MSLIVGSVQLDDGGRYIAGAAGSTVKYDVLVIGE